MTRPSLALAVVASWMLFARIRTSRQRDWAIGLSVLLALDVGTLAHPPRAIGHAVFVIWYGVTASVVVGATYRQAWPIIIPTFAILAAFRGTGPATFWLALALQVIAAGLAVGRREIPDQVATVGLILAASSLADVAGPWLLGRYQQEWAIGRIPAIVTWLSIAGWELRCWMGARRRGGSS